MPSILGANSVSGYEIENSMRFNRGDAACLRKTFSGSPSSTKACTISFWTKLGAPQDTNAKAIFSAIKSGSNEDVIKFMGVNNSILNALEINFNNTNAGTMMISDGNDTLIKFRDPSAWYHFVIAIDSGDGTATNRVKAYVNGTQRDVQARVEGGSITDDVVLTENYELGFLTASAHSIGENVESAGNEPYDGYLADFNFIDGQQLDPSYFGETNNNGVWVPKKYAGSYGNYGFFLEFQGTGTSADASGKGADTSGNGNHFDDANATAADITTDTPTNNYAILNPVSDISTSVTFTEGNTRASIGNGSTNRSVGSMGFTSGKWYWEVKYISTSSGASHLEIGFVDTVIGLRYHIRGNDGERWDNGSSSSGTNHRHDPDDIIGVYVDADNQKWYLQVNGSNSNGGNGAADVSAGTGFIHQSFAVTDFILPYFANASGGGGHIFEVNFGNAPFTISSSNSDANGHGSFEYDPTNDGVNFYALNSKNLAEFG